jgi:carboxypeptidase C (cathepsin A)
MATSAHADIVAKPSAESASGNTQSAARLVDRLLTPMSSVTHGTVNVEGQTINYKAVAGTLVVSGTGSEESTPEAAMSYFAYFKRGTNPAKRPITFIYNGGPGSSTMWLHMGAWGPKRIVTNDHSHTPAAPYKLVDNNYSLLDASDLVFIDMPATGFGRLLPQGKDAGARAKDRKRLAKKIWNVDGDAKAFSRFIMQFLSNFNRWNSPKYLYGESYGTYRSAVLARILELQDHIDLNGIVLQSTVLDEPLRIDSANGNPGVGIGYALALPSMAATAWYHRKLPKYDGHNLAPLLKEVINFATGDYQQALEAGSTLSADKKSQIAKRLHAYIGLPVKYLLKANLRVDGRMFEHELLSSNDTTTGRLDTRFAGPSMNPQSENAEYDPQSAAIGSAYISAFNNYVRSDLKFGLHMKYRPSFHGFKIRWGWQDKLPRHHFANGGILNAMFDLATAMKYNPNLKVKVFGGFFDLATPFYTAIYEMHHLPIPRSLQKNISYNFFPSGHMIYVHLPSLKKLHDDTARFIESTDNLHGKNK